METVLDIKNRINQHVLSLGGWWAVNESDSYLNDANRDLIAAFKRERGAALMGKINIDDSKRRNAIASGTESPYKEYTGDLVYNFGCDFVVSEEDEELTLMLRTYCKDGKFDAAIFTRIEQIGGECFIWS